LLLSLFLMSSSSTLLFRCFRLSLASFIREARATMLLFFFLSSEVSTSSRMSSSSSRVRSDVLTECYSQHMTMMSLVGLIPNLCHRPQPLAGAKTQGQTSLEETEEFLHLLLRVKQEQMSR
jgi:hypothetical protein